MSTARQPQGIPAGGQFAPTTHPEPGVSLVNAQPPTHTPAQARDLVKTAAIARGVLEEYPDAKFMGLQLDQGDDDSDFVAGVTVLKADYTEIGQHSIYDEDEDARDWMDSIHGLTADPSTAAWAAYNPPFTMPDDDYTIDLAQATAWTPGGE